jgi:ATP-binding cassette subfamily B protein/subfamily B ATP-binding cassette protein MsbA
MDAFYRALRDAFRYWPLLAASLLCSTGVACMWGANIAALYPIIEITLSGKSMQEWNSEQQKQSRINIEAYEQQIAAQQTVIDNLDTPSLVEQNKLDKLRSLLQIEHVTLESNEKLAPYFVKYFPETPYGTVLLIVALILVGNVLKQILLLVNQTMISYISASIARDIRKKLFDKALQLDRPTYMNIGTGGFASQITHATEMLGHGVMCFYGGAVTEPLKIIVCLAGAWFISWRLLLCSLLIAPVVTLLVIWLNKKIKSVARSSLDRSLGFHHVILESLNNLLTVQAYTMESHERERFRLSTQAMMRNSMWASFYNALAGPITEVFGIGMVCTAILAGAYLVIHRETHVWGIQMTDQPITASGLMIFFGMLISTNDPVRKLSGVISAINTGSVAAASLYHMIDTPPMIADPLVAKTVNKPHGLLEFRNVSFAYHGHENVLNHVNLQIPFGQRVAIVGPNGGGKSTLMNLLCRFYDPTQGEVLLDGVSLRDMNIEDVRGRIALVTQHTEMFNESILFNIRYGRWDASDEEVIAAAKKAFAHDFIDSFPQKYETLVGPNGHRLSGGQRQRIALARALLRNAEIMVLDEATSQIDMASEELIHAALRELGRHRTMLMITHRPSTLSLADVVLSIDHGKLTVQKSSESRAA